MARPESLGLVIDVAQRAKPLAGFELPNTLDVADHFDLKRDIQFKTCVTAASTPVPAADPNRRTISGDNKLGLYRQCGGAKRVRGTRQNTGADTLLIQPVVLSR